MQMEIWHIEGRNFHFGQLGLGQEKAGVIFPSDSLYSALIARLSLLEEPESVAKFCQPFLEGDAPFGLTSAFPYAGEVHLFPIPMGVSIRGSLSDRSKDIKRIRFVSERIFRLTLAKEPLEDMYEDGLLCQGGSVLLDKQDLQGLPTHCATSDASIWSLGKRPRVTLDRASSSSTIYHTGHVSFSPGCGLWFGVHWRQEDPESRSQLKRILMDLADAGLGGERSVGFGACTIKHAGQIQLPSPEGNTWVSLSRYLPAMDEMEAIRSEDAAYKLQRIGGWVTTTQGLGHQRRAIHLIIEGSCLGALENPLPGDMVDVQPRYAQQSNPLDHPVYRCGVAIGAGMIGGQP